MFGLRLVVVLPGTLRKIKIIKLAHELCLEGVWGPRLHNQNENFHAHKFLHLYYAILASPPDTILALMFFFVRTVPGDGLPLGVDCNRYCAWRLRPGVLLRLWSSQHAVHVVAHGAEHLAKI